MTSVAAENKDGDSLDCKATSDLDHSDFTNASSTSRSRFLTQEENVFAHNAWDDVIWNEEMISSAEKSIQTNSTNKMKSEDADDVLKNSAGNWDKFYGVHEHKFFKDRNWLLKEFPELDHVQDLSQPIQESGAASKSFKVLETGCGVGNTVFPLLQYTNSRENYFVYGCDFSQEAIKLTHENPLYDKNRCLTFVWDLTNVGFVPAFEEGSLDVIVMIFVLSAIQPKFFQPVLSNLARFLKPGGVLLFRDYGRYDMAQLRFKEGRCIESNFYCRGDGTQVYFFTQEELHNLLTGSGLQKVQNMVDRRLQVNRGKQIKMYRVWIQCKYEKPIDDKS